MLAVVKISSSIEPSRAIAKYDLIKQTGLKHLAFFEECRVEGKPAILMEDLFTSVMVYVSPNSVKQGWIDNKPEAYLLDNKLNDVVNMDSLLMEMRDLVDHTNDSGIGLDMDMISFGVQRGNKDSIVSYKLVDIDAMLWDHSYCGQLYQTNAIAAKEAITLFVKLFIETDSVKQKLLKQIESFNWKIN